MIVKIWPIKADYAGAKGKVGGVEGLKNCVAYIKDEAKSVVEYADRHTHVASELLDTQPGSYVNVEPDFSRVVEYMSNEDKTKEKYVSSYLCFEDNTTLEFRRATELLELKSNWKVERNSGAVAFHLVQSFPENLDIEDEEVHECGMELVRKLEKYQALVCSHVHPVMDEDGELHGKCKHNHILINAYVHPDFYDPNKGGPGKYNDCVDSYRQLQIWNDEIAIQHGLPIIRNPEMNRVYTWKERAEINKGTSWKERVRMDIEKVRRVARDWDDFRLIMCDEGYQLTDKKYVTYITPDGNRVRDFRLGERFTKDSLNLYWSIRDHARDAIKNDLNANEEPILSDFVYHYGEKLSVKIPLGPQFLENRQFAYMPISKDTKAEEAALRTYMEIDKLYDICDEDGRCVAAASGIEILRSIEDLKDDGRMAYRAQMRMKEEEIRKEREMREKNKAEELRMKKQYYFNKNFRSSWTGEVYHAELFDNGRRRSPLELIYVLALVILDKESYLWVPRNEIPHEQENEIFFATTNYKLQYLMDSIEIAKQEDVNTPAQLSKRFNSVGAAYSRTKSSYGNTFRAAERMEPIMISVEDYKRTRQLAQSILAMEDGLEKAEMQKKYANLIEEYKAAKHVLYVNRLETDEAIADFEARYQRITQDVAVLESRMNEYGEQYSRLKKLAYSLQLAEDPRFVYGVSYPKEKYMNLAITEREEVPSLWHKIDSAQIRRVDLAVESEVVENREEEQQADKG